MGEVRCLARADPPPPAEGGSGWRRILSAIAVASRTGANKEPPRRGAQRRARVPRRLGRRQGAWGRRGYLDVEGRLRRFGGRSG